MILLSPALLRSAHAADGIPDSLGVSSGVPWNPPHPIARRLAWEQALLLPGRLVSLPLSGLGYLTDNLLLRLDQSPRFANGLQRSDARTAIRGSLKTGDRSGLGAGVLVRQDLLSGQFQSRVSAEYSGTLHQYDRTLIGWSGRPLSLQYGYEWRPQDRFYGFGNESREADASDYAHQSEFVRGALAWKSNPRAPQGPSSSITLWAGPRSQITGSGRAVSEVSYEARFPELGEATLDRRVENLVYGASLVHDRRAGSPHWSHGWRTQLSAERFGAPARALALHSGSGDAATFTRVQAEAEAGFSFMRDPRTVRLLVRIADQQIGSHQDRLLASDYSTLGGSTGLAGYPSGRFRDLDLVLMRLGYVFPLQRMLEMDLHSEWGAVTPDLWSSPNLNALHNSVGLSLRVRSDRAPRAAVGLDFSREGFRARLSLGGVE